MNRIDELQNELSEKWERYKRQFLSLYLSAAAVYLPLIVLRLTNDMDGMWDQDDHLTGAAELRMGRWFWVVLDKIRGTVSLDPLPALVSLAVFTIGVLFLFSLLQIDPQTKREKVAAWIAGMLILCAPTVLCQLSYSHMSINDSVSFLLAVLAVWVVRKKAFAATVALSALLVALMMGGYQASLGVTCMAALFAFLFLLREREKATEALRFAGQMLAALVAGALLYEIVWQAALAITGETMSDYNGADAVSLSGMLTSLPSSVKHTFSSFSFFFGRNGYHYNLLQSEGWFLLIYLMPLAGAGYFVWRLWRKRGWQRAVLGVCSFLLIPIFANSVFLVAVSAETMMQMTMGMVMVWPLMLCLMVFGESAPENEEQNEEKNEENKTREMNQQIEDRAASTAGKGRLLRTAAGLVFAFVLYGMIGQNLVDQYAMYAGRRATQTLAQQILNEWNLAGVDYTENVVMVYGVPNQSPLFVRSELYEKANSYAKYGTFATTTEGNRLCWFHYFEQQLRLNVNYAEGDTLETIYNSSEVAAMPVFPAAGSTANVWGVTVVKVSE